MLKTDANVDQDDVVFSGETKTFWTFVLWAGNLAGDVKREYAALGSTTTMDAADIRKRFEAFDWIMSTANDEVQSVYFPGVFHQLLVDLTHFPALKRLSLDAQWVKKAEGFGLANFAKVDLGPLGALPGLEELYLPADVEPIDLGFLGKMSNLQYLQISPRRSKLGLPGFEQGKSLKKLTLLNSPSRQVLGEVQMIMTLEELTIVDLRYQFVDPKVAAKLIAMFPNVKVTVVDSVEYRANTTQEFRDHIEQVKQEIFDLLKLDEKLGSKR